jgi:uncharacterized SAM-dependent methyltransferase
VPQFPDDQVKGGVHYAQYVTLPTSLIPQRQPLLLKSFAGKIQDVLQSGASFFDLGPGPKWSVRHNTIPALRLLKPSCYIAVDLEPEFTEDACTVVSQEFPDINVRYLARNFHKYGLPQLDTPVSIIWYPGSTLGNLPSFPGQSFVENIFVMEHLALLRKNMNCYGNGEAQTRYLILLMDRKKDDIQSMLNLYASPEAVGCFQSILFKLKRDLQATDFEPEAFRYQPRWNAVSSAVEHIFTATKAQLFRIHNCFTGAWATIRIQADAQYVLANSLKPSCDEMQNILIRSGWKPIQSEADPEHQFHIHLAQACSVPEK